MAESYISELGDKLSHGVANTDGTRVKIIAPVYYTDGSNHPSIATALSGKAASSHTHGSITNDGKIGSTANLSVVTGTSGAVTTSDLTTAAPAASGNALAFIDSVSQDSKGKITATKKNVTIDDALSGSSTNPLQNKVTTGAIRQIKSNIDTAISQLPSSEDIEDLSLAASYDDTNKRLVFDNITFDSIYPSVGKYGLAIFPENDTAAATEFDGDREWLLDWRPYLVDMTTVEGEVRKTPVAELKKNNWLRKIDGSYAPAVGITSAQSTALNGKKDTLYWKTGSAGDKVSATIAAAFDTSGNFVPSAFWEYVKDNLSTVNTKSGATYNYPIEVKVYVGSTAYSYGDYTNNHIPAPWETTETKYSVFIGRDKDCYVIDGYSATTGEHMRGLSAKPVEVGSEGFDPEDYRLSRTGIAPGPCTTVGSKIRAFFYNYNGVDSYTKGNAGTVANAIFYNNGTYPRTADASQYTTANWARGCNSGGTSGNAVPVGEGGYHAFNAFMCSVESAFGTRALHAATMFSSGISANDTANAVNGGLVVAGTYYAWSSSSHGLGGSNNASQTINGFYTKFQCMEPQIAASLAAEMGVAANSSFKWNGGTWHWEQPTAVTGYAINGLLSGEMNCRIYKMTDSASINSKAVQCNLRCSLIEGVNSVGDIWWYMGGGAELVYLTDGTGNTNYKYSFYLEPDQTKWLATNTTEKITSGGDTARFPAETAYKAIVVNGSTGGLGNSYCKARFGYTPVRRIDAASNTVSGECCYQYRQIDDDAKGSAGIRSRRWLLFRGASNHTGCSPRLLYANYRPSNTSAAFGCSAQVLLA